MQDWLVTKLRELFYDPIKQWTQADLISLHKKDSGMSIF